jgi:hypothetical protein
MGENPIDSETISKPESAAGPSKRTRKAKAKPPAKTGRAKKPANKPEGDRTNKKADVIAMMKHAKGVTLPEIVKATGWQPHGIAVWVFLPQPRWRGCAVEGEWPDA